MSIFDYYKILNKPYFSPPPAVFGIVWPILYVLMAVSFVLVLLSPKTGNKSVALALFIVQLVINLSWTKIFFADKNLELAFWVCVLLTIIVIFMTILFFRQSVWAGVLQIPYCLWLIFACYLSYTIKLMNTN
ncbi:tryptophan-rich sensory protein [bacterium]|nr:tryptophan-rich sensory protein [bacterium]